MIQKWTLLCLICLFISGCGSTTVPNRPTLIPDNPSAPDNPSSKKDFVPSLELGVNEAGDFFVKGEVAFPVKEIKKIVGIDWVLGFETTIREARDTQNYLYIVWENEDIELIVNQYDIGQPFDIRFSERDWVRKISHSGDGNLVVFVEKDVLIAETYGASSSSCPGAPPQQIVVGERAYVCTQSESVRVRLTAGVLGEELTRLSTGTSFKVVKGPRCSDNWSWWRIRTGDGIVGWISEGGDEKDNYFICPK